MAPSFATDSLGRARRALGGAELSDHPARIITRASLLEFLSITEPTLERLERLGKAPPKTRLSTNRVGYRLDKVLAWLEARTDRGEEAA